MVLSTLIEVSTEYYFFLETVKRNFYLLYATVNTDKFGYINRGDIF